MSVKHCHHTCSFMPLPHLAATLSFFYCGKSSKKNPPLQLSMPACGGCFAAGLSLFLNACPLCFIAGFNFTLSGIWMAKKQRLQQHSFHSVLLLLPTAHPRWRLAFGHLTLKKPSAIHPEKNGVTCSRLFKLCPLLPGFHVRNPLPFHSRYLQPPIIKCGK